MREDLERGTGEERQAAGESESAGQVPESGAEGVAEDAAGRLGQVGGRQGGDGEHVRAVVQRVAQAAVWVAEERVGAIGPGLMVLVGVGQDDSPGDAVYIAEKVAHLRIFPGGDGRMDRSALEVGGEILVVSQFTLYGDTRRGRRPSYARAAGGATALALYEAVGVHLRALGLRVETGRFGAEMRLELTCTGPVTLLLESGATC